MHPDRRKTSANDGRGLTDSLNGGTRNTKEAISKRPLRFAVFSVFFLVMGGLVTVAFGDGQYTPFAVQSAKFGGLLITFAFWSFEDRISQLFRYFRDNAARLERAGLGYWEYVNVPRRRLLEAGQVTRMFYICMLACWIYATAVSLL